MLCPVWCTFITILFSLDVDKGQQRLGDMAERVVDDVSVRGSLIERNHTRLHRCVLVLVLVGLAN